MIRIFYRLRKRKRLESMVKFYYGTKRRRKKKSWREGKCQLILIYFFFNDDLFSRLWCSSFPHSSVIPFDTANKLFVPKYKYPKLWKVSLNGNSLIFLSFYSLLFPKRKIMTYGKIVLQYFSCTQFLFSFLIEFVYPLLRESLLREYFIPFMTCFCLSWYLLNA